MSDPTNHDLGSDEEEDHDLDTSRDAKEVNQPTTAAAAAPTDEDEEEEEDDDEDDEDDEEDDDVPQRKRRRRLNHFFDDEAEVDDDDEEVDEEEEEGFIADEELPEINDHREYREEHRHRELDRQHEQQQAEDLEAMAEELRNRHGRSKRGRGPDSGLVPRRLLLPSVQDPNIWGVKCRPGKEREVIFSIIKKMEELEGTKRPMPIISAFERDAMQGYIYVEAYKQSDVLEALTGISNVYPRSPQILVPIKEMPDLLNVVKSVEIMPGAWVRLKRGKYQGDLAQVENVLANGLEVRIRMVPRLDYGNSSLERNRDDPNLPPGQKRKRVGNFNKANTVAGRPPQRLFSENEAQKNHAKMLSKGTAANGGRKNYTYMGDEYEDGYLVKDVRLTHITTEGVNPTLEEVTKFASTVDEGAETLDLNALAQSLKTSISTYQVGDTVEVYDGEQQGMIGKAVSVHGDIVTMDVIEGELKGKRLEVPFKGLRKRFREGDHVKVTGGRFRDETGTVVRILEDKVTLVTGEENIEEITVFSKDLREAADGGMSKSSKYDLHDLVQIDASTVGCVIKTERASLRVLDQNGDLRVVILSQIADRISRRNAVAIDRNGSEIRLGDTVKEIGGNTRTGVVLHIYRSFVFLHSREITENHGVFVCRASNVATIAAKGGRIDQAAGPDLSKMNPALLRNGASGGNMMPPPKVGGRDRTIGQTVTVRLGPYKGLMGIVKDATDHTARVELHTKNKTITIEKMKLGFRDSITGAIKSYQDFARPVGRGDGGGGFRVPGGSNTPSWNSGSRTPQIDHLGTGNRTPAWMANNDGGRTPAYVSGGRTPAWGGGDGSRSVYQGNRTPAWNPSSRTPYIADSERSAWDAGSKTPGRPSVIDSWGQDSSSFTNTTARTPGAYGAASPEFIPPPFSAPTPGNPLSAPTPSAPTPGPISASTPSGWGAETAPTPGASSGYGRGGFPSTPGTWEIDDDE